MQAGEGVVGPPCSATPSRETELIGQNRVGSVGGRPWIDGSLEATLGAQRAAAPGRGREGAQARSRFSGQHVLLTTARCAAIGHPGAVVRRPPKGDAGLAAHADSPPIRREACSAGALPTSGNTRASFIIKHEKGRLPATSCVAEGTHESNNSYVSNATLVNKLDTKENCEQ